MARDVARVVVAGAPHAYLERDERDGLEWVERGTLPSFGFIPLLASLLQMSADVRRTPRPVTQRTPYI